MKEPIYESRTEIDRIVSAMQDLHLSNNVKVVIVIVDREGGCVVASPETDETQKVILRQALEQNYSEADEYWEVPAKVAQ